MTSTAVIENLCANSSIFLDMEHRSTTSFRNMQLYLPEGRYFMTVMYIYNLSNLINLIITDVQFKISVIVM